MSNNLPLTWNDRTDEEQEFITIFRRLTGEQQLAILHLMRTLTNRTNSGTDNHNQSGRR